MDKARTRKPVSRERILLTATVAAFIAAFATFIAMLQLEKNELSAYEKEEVYVVTCPIAMGTEINQDNIANYAKIEKIDKSVIGENSLKSVEEIGNKAAQYDIGQGTILCRDMFLDIDQFLSQLKDPVLLSLKADDCYQVVGGELRSGDRICIYYSDEAGNIYHGWDDIYVKSAFDSAGNRIDPGDTTTCATRINIYFEKDSVEDLYTKMLPGTLRLVKTIEN